MYCAAITNQHRPMWGVQRLCMHGASCVKYGCPYKHPSERPRDCPDGARCQKRDVCKLHHPRSSNEIACPFGMHCDKLNCTFAHNVSKAPTRFQKPCMHGAFCVKFGCGYAHPPGRRAECEFGVLCTDETCQKLHPRASKKDVSNSTEPKFKIGQQVQAQYNVGATWRLANVLAVQSYTATLQFVGWTDTVDVPFERIKDTQAASSEMFLPSSVKLSAGSTDIPPGFGSLISRGAAVARPALLSNSPRTASPRIPRLSPKSVMPKKIIRNSPKFESENMMQLERLKQAAIAKENYLLANELKQRMEKMNNLERKKAAAVRKEDFLLALEIKKEITDLLTMTPPPCNPVGAETKQECDNRCERPFSLFDKSVGCQTGLTVC